ncbi:hypothetical protein AN618_01110 [Fervidicola ferrireducens]|uniref:Flagellar protein FlgN n=1 Tax=Fervidicola ferrireducens TaxID=520764 RepID=A0A140LDZ8_9FIRM|nr:hypothetical protein [Fervidicola ferrireducens]KXG78773.1 hypothetical protein AN618_01110 [Fervidicola ferrireducens]
MEVLFSEKIKNLEEILAITLKMKEAVIAEDTSALLELVEKRRQLIEISEKIDEKIKREFAGMDEGIESFKRSIREKLLEIKMHDEEVVKLAKKLYTDIERKINDLNFAKKVTQRYTDPFSKANFGEGFFIDKRE